MNIVFFGTPDFIVPVADSLLGTKDINIAAVATNPDRPTGRKQIITPTPLKQWAIEHNIQALTPEILDDNFFSQLTAHNPQLGVLASYGKIIPKKIIDLFPKGIIVIHPSLLPKYRGPIPVPAAILYGDKKTGSTFLLMDERMDHGPILHKFESPINLNDTHETLLYRIWQESAEKLPEVLTGYLEGKIVPQSQDDSRATYTKLFTKEDGFIPWSILREAQNGQQFSMPFAAPFVKPPLPINTSYLLLNYIRALSPWPGVWTLLRPDHIGASEGQAEKRLKVLRAHLETRKLANSQIPVLTLDIVQLEGKNPQPYAEVATSLPK